METQYNIRSPAVKRLMREAEELRHATQEFYAQPLDDNLFEWHFTVRGPPDSDFDGGYYHGRIILPTEYPMKPPSIIMLTPNGRFETNKKICLSISGFHPESWQPSWSIRTALLAIIGFMPTEGLGAIGSLDYPADERKSLAIKSQKFQCNSCGVIKNLLKEERDDHESEANKEAKELAKQICFKGVNAETSQSSSAASNVTNESSEANQNPEEIANELRQRNVIESHSTGVNQIENTQNLNSFSSSSRFTTYLMVIIAVTIGLLLLRRLFFL